MAGTQTHPLTRALCVVVCVWACVVSSVKVNIVHTTDIHGWVAGHAHNTTLDADFGDFHSLLLHMQANAIKNGEEFLLFDTGDLIEGTGLSDATPIHGQYIFEIIKNVSTYNGLTMGNHDIGHPEVVTLMQASFIPYWNGTYLTSNSEMQETDKFIGQPYAVFTTKLGTKVLVLGYLFNFTHEANNTIVVPVSISLTQPYFQQAMQVPDVDMIVVCSHIAPQFGPELGQIYTSIRKFHPDTPLVMLAGHSHVTYFNSLDPNAFTIESGKYFEVIGVINFELAQDGSMQNLATQWVDTSVQNFMTLSGTTAQTFDTPQGLKTSSLIQSYWQELGLNIVYGCAPNTYYPDIDYRDPYSLYQLYVEQVIPKIVFDNSNGHTQFFISNTASLRYNLYAGPVTRNDIYTISPFNDTFVEYAGFPGKALVALMQNIMNTSGLAGERVLTSRYCGIVGDSTPNWYYSSVPITDDGIYDVVLASYDAETIYPVVRHLFSGQSYAHYSTYPTTENGTGALQAFIETVWPCSH
jgi:2',3'-cyclic-nucleotide 2'-phosphodiesterase (5'-nucleotidase family)